MPENRFVGRIAEGYDEASSDRFDPAVLDPTVDFLAELAGDGAALELAIGTGRVAIPLTRRGVPVHGIDISQDMVNLLLAKPGAEAVEVTIGDFAVTRVDGTFSLAYLVYNTIMNLTTQQEQVRCFENAAAHLAPGGCFVIEVIVPGLRRLPPGETVLAFEVTPGHLGFEEYTDIPSQIVYSHHYWIDHQGGSARTFSAPFRYVWPSELDLMARIAGMTLRERWSDWSRAPFTGESRSHVSVWQKL